MMESGELEALGEKLQTALVDLTRCREREARYRDESHTLLKGVETLADAKTLERVLESLIEVLRPFIGFEHADVVAWEGEQGITHLSSETGEQGRFWSMTPAFARAIAGETLVIYDPSLLPELAPLTCEPGWASLLLTGLQAPGFTAILICRHSLAGTFDLTSKAAMQRCRPLIAQALVNITYRARLQEQVAAKTEALQASERRFRSFAAMASDWFWETDAEHRLILPPNRVTWRNSLPLPPSQPCMTISTTSRVRNPRAICGCLSSGRHYGRCGFWWPCRTEPAGWR